MVTFYWPERPMLSAHGEPAGPSPPRPGSSVPPTAPLPRSCFQALRKSGTRLRRLPTTSARQHANPVFPKNSFEYTKMKACPKSLDRLEIHGLANLSRAKLDAAGVQRKACLPEAEMAEMLVMLAPMQPYPHHKTGSLPATAEKRRDIDAGIFPAEWKLAFRHLCFP